MSRIELNYHSHPILGGTACLCGRRADGSVRFTQFRTGKEGLWGADREWPMPDAILDIVFTEQGWRDFLASIERTDVAECGK